MKFECFKCGICCLSIFPITVSDINLWTENDRTDILSTLTWYTTEDNFHRLIIPKKSQIIHHSILIRLFRQEFKDNKLCIFAHRKDGKIHCSIYELRPQHCKLFPFNKLKATCIGLTGKVTKIESIKRELRFDMRRAEQEMHKERDTISKVINRAKKEVSLIDIAKIVTIGGDKNGKTELNTIKDSTNNGTERSNNRIQE